MASSPRPKPSQLSASLTLEPPSPHPFAHSTSLLTLIPSPRFDAEEESRFYDEFLSEEEDVPITRIHPNRDVRRIKSMPAVKFNKPSEDQRSVFSNDIWIGDASGTSKGFARDVSISGWVFVGDKKRGAYIVYDCVLTTKEGTVMHVLRRYSAFEQLHTSLLLSLPRGQAAQVPNLPPKSALARYRPAFLNSRRRSLQIWLSTVLLHPDIGGSPAVREWVMDGVGETPSATPLSSPLPPLSPVL